MTTCILSLEQEAQQEKTAGQTQQVKRNVCIYNGRPRGQASPIGSIQNAHSFRLIRQLRKWKAYGQSQSPFIGPRQGCPLCDALVGTEWANKMASSLKTDTNMYRP